jgi:hypothetical protein
VFNKRRLWEETAGVRTRNDTVDLLSTLEWSLTKRLYHERSGRTVSTMAMLLGLDTPIAEAKDRDALDAFYPPQEQPSQNSVNIMAGVAATYAVSDQYDFHWAARFKKFNRSLYRDSSTGVDTRFWPGDRVYLDIAFSLYLANATARKGEGNSYCAFVMELNYVYVERATEELTVIDNSGGSFMNGTVGIDWAWGGGYVLTLGWSAPILLRINGEQWTERQTLIVGMRFPFESELNTGRSRTATDRAIRTLGY